jgi:hypothetical protein
MKVRCEECAGHGVITIAVDTGTVGTGYFREEICEECDGEGEIDVRCMTCEQPVREDGFCQSCDDWQLTECLSDPLLKRKAA